MSKEKILEVNNLAISFKTPNGLVKAVRNISFDLYKGETLAIVGESGSGKSVTNRAIMGILAGNGIIDDGEILYRNQDLAKLSEENFHKIRGSKIGMIFQDPLSSLNPIMRIGKQITEAMLVNGNRFKSRFRDLYHVEFHNYLNVETRIKLIKKEAGIRIFGITKDDEMPRADKKALISKIKHDSHRMISKLKKELPDLKKKYLAAKKLAKIQINTEVKEVKTERKESFLELAEEVKRKKQAMSQISKSSDGYKSAHEDYEKSLDARRSNRELYRRRFKVTKKEAYERAIKIMREVGIPEPEKRFTQYPFQFSGGMRQRIVIAIALTASPEMLICDEPTTALDVTIQQQILDLIKDIKKERNLSVIFITHDLGVVANMADRVAVMYAGKIVEYGDATDIFYDPRHPYTWALLSSVPDLDTTERLLSIAGTPPDMLFPPKGDAFADRNQYAMQIDFEEEPPFFKINDHHYAATWLLHPNAPKIEIPKIIQDRINKYKKDARSRVDDKTSVKSKTRSAGDENWAKTEKKF